MEWLFDVNFIGYPNGQVVLGVLFALLLFGMGVHWFGWPLSDDESAATWVNMCRIAEEHDRREKASRLAEAIVDDLQLIQWRKGRR